MAPYITVEMVQQVPSKSPKASPVASVRAAYDQYSSAPKALYTRLVGQAEKRKEEKGTGVVIVSRSKWKAASRVLVHVIPIGATTAIAVLNLGGFFIGELYQGPTNDTFQSMAQLALQITAKLYELVIVGSLSTIVWDILRREMLVGSEGLPLGLLSAKDRIGDLSYWVSPDFWFGQAGVTLKKRLKIILVLFVCAVIALLAGPSSAMLMIPQDFTDWPAGGASIFMKAAEETISPSHITQPLSLCKVATPAFGSGSAEPGTCVPSSAFSLSQLLVKGKYSGSTIFWNSSVVVDVNDGLVNRHIRIRKPNGDVGAPGGDTWAVSPHLTPSLFSQRLVGMWWDGIYNTPTTKQTGRKYYDRKGDGTKAQVKSDVPLVRVNCMDQPIRSFSDIELSAEGRFPIQPFDGEALPSNTLWSTPSNTLPFSKYYNSTNITTVWFTPHSSATLGTTLDEANVASGFSSAYINIQIPPQDDRANNGTAGALVSCSIDARWAPGTVEANTLAFHTGYEYYDARIKVGDSGLHFPEESGFVYRDLPGGLSNLDSRPVRLGLDFLNSLNPELDPQNHPGYTSFSSMFETLGMQMAFARPEDQFPEYRFWNRDAIEIAIATTVADGMAHVGYVENGGGEEFIMGVSPFMLFLARPNDDFDVSSIVDANNRTSSLGEIWAAMAPEQRQAVIDNALGNYPTLKEDLVSGKLVLNRLPESTDAFRWTVTITGKAYWANSLAYYLALALLFTHAIVAIVHAVWSLYRCETSDAWSRFVDLFALAANSRPPPELGGTSGGIKDHALLGKPVRIRDVSAVDRGDGYTTGYSSGDTGVFENRIQLVVGGLGWQEAGEGVIQANIAY